MGPAGPVSRNPPAAPTCSFQGQPPAPAMKRQPGRDTACEGRRAPASHLTTLCPTSLWSSTALHRDVAIPCGQVATCFLLLVPLQLGRPPRACPLPSSSSLTLFREGHPLPPTCCPSGLCWASCPSSEALLLPSWRWGVFTCEQPSIPPPTPPRRYHTPTAPQHRTVLSEHLRLSVGLGRGG